MKKIIAIIGARPQFIKHFPFEKAAENKLDLITIHTGQHYDNNMSSVFFEQLNMSKPSYMLNNGGGNHGEQTGKMMIDIENIIIKEKPDGVVVYGDTNSTLAGALVASKLHIPTFHIEAGLRSYNKEMPEEINRILTDHVSSMLFVTSQVAIDNLNKEGINKNIVLVGDLMKDIALYAIRNDKIKKVSYKSYYYATIHRPYNTDNPKRLLQILNTFDSLSKKVVLAIHPRTLKIVKDNKIDFSKFKNIIIIDPQGYFENLSYINNSNCLITDSGGMQKEAYWLKKKCITIRTETEWTETITLGGNELVFDNLETIQIKIKHSPTSWEETLYGDGFAAEKIVEELVRYNYKN